MLHRSLALLAIAWVSPLVAQQPALAIHYARLLVRAEPAEASSHLLLVRALETSSRPRQREILAHLRSVLERGLIDEPARLGLVEEALLVRLLDAAETGHPPGVEAKATSDEGGADVPADPPAGRATALPSPAGGRIPGEADGGPEHAGNGHETATGVTSAGSSAAATGPNDAPEAASAGPPAADAQPLREETRALLLRLRGRPGDRAALQRRHALERRADQLFARPR